MKKIEEEWFTIEDIQPSENMEELICLGVDSPTHEFLAGDIDVPTCNTEEGKEAAAQVDEMSVLISSLLRLSRAAGIYVVGALQRPDATILSGANKNNMPTRIAGGSMSSTASSMIFDSNEGTRINTERVGRLLLKVHSTYAHGQGFHQKETWFDDWLEENGFNLDGSKKDGTPPVILGETMEAPDMSTVEKKENFGRPEDDWDSDMDDIMSLR